jgi:hypothetical protein
MVLAKDSLGTVVTADTRVSVRRVVLLRCRCRQLRFMLVG